jgi:hypothetical protein
MRETNTLPAFPSPSPPFLSPSLPSPPLLLFPLTASASEPKNFLVVQMPVGEF